MKAQVYMCKTCPFRGGLLSASAEGSLQMADIDILPRLNKDTL